MISKELIVENEPRSPISESFRALRTNLQFMNSSEENKQTILITSTSPSEGKSWVSSNIAIAYAQAGKKTCLVDIDMRKSKVFTIFNIAPTPGVSNYLTGVNISNKDRHISNFMQETEIENLYIIPAGNIPPNPSELLISDKMKKMIDELKECVDVVVFDGTPCSLVTDSTIVSRMVDQTIIISEYNTTKLEDLKETKKAIESAGGRVSGVVLNKMPISKKKYSTKYYYGNRLPEGRPEPEKDKLGELLNDLEMPVKPEIETDIPDMQMSFADLEEDIKEPEKSEEVMPEMVKEPEKIEEVIPEMVEDPEESGEIIPEMVEEPEKAEEVIPEMVEEPEESGEIIPEMVEEPEKTEEVITEMVEEPEEIEEIIPEMVEEPEKTEEVIPEMIEKPEEIQDIFAGYEDEINIIDKKPVKEEKSIEEPRKIKEEK